MKKKDVYNRAKSTWGIDAQVTKAVEELSELIKELSKFLIDDGNMDHITDEMADVEIMVEQLKLIFENKRAVKVVKKAKIQRLNERLDEEENLVKSCVNCISGNEPHRYFGHSCSEVNYCRNYSLWELYAENKVVKKCYTCKHRSVPTNNNPCFSCKDRDNWAKQYNAE